MLKTTTISVEVVYVFCCSGPNTTILPVCIYRAEESLKDWRDEARTLQRQQDLRVRVDGKLTYQKAEETAPFGTDLQHDNMDTRDSSPALLRLKV